jgi:hypothetical protein
MYLWLVGGVYGLISSAVAGNFQQSCFNSSNLTPRTATRWRMARMMSLEAEGAHDNAHPDFMEIFAVRIYCLIGGDIANRFTSSSEGLVLYLIH